MLFPRAKKKIPKRATQPLKLIQRNATERKFSNFFFPGDGNQSGIAKRVRWGYMVDGQKKSVSWGVFKLLYTKSNPENETTRRQTKGKAKISVHDN